MALPLPNSSIWSRTAAGAADGSHNLTVANFYFGGFGNNYVDDGPIQRFREYISLPGFGLQEVSALHFVKELVEWNVPPVIFEDVGVPSLYLTWLRPTIFVGGTVDRADQRFAAQELHEPRRAGRPALHHPASVRNDAVRRLCGRLPGIAEDRRPSG